MNMIKHVLLTMLLFITVASIAQSKNPYKSIGKKGEILTLTKGKYEELFDQDSIQQIGTVLINVRTMKVVKLLEDDEAKERLQNEKQSRFLSVDPLTGKFAMLTPYQYASNTPVWAIDLDGLEGVPSTFRPILFTAHLERVSNEAIILKLQHPTWGSFRLHSKAAWNVTTGYAHDILDVVGLAPGVGEPADFINGVLYTLKGDKTNATLSFAGTVPVAGWAATGIKWSKNVLKLSDNAFHSASGLIFKAGSKDGNRLSHVLQHTADDLTKPKHGIFDVGDKLVESLDDAYSKAANTKWTKQLKVGESETVGGVTKTLQEMKGSGGTTELRESFVIDMGTKVGYEGGKQGTGAALNKINLVLKQGTSEVVTAYPVK